MKITRLIAAFGAPVLGLCVAAISLSSQAFSAERKPNGPLSDAPEAAAGLIQAGGNGINHHGGPVMLGNIRLYYIWYGVWDVSAKSILADFANSIGGSSYFNIETTYFDGSNTPVSNSVSYGGSASDDYSLGKSLSDDDVQTVVSRVLMSGSLPTDPNGVYFVLTSPDVTETSGFTTAYCAWHKWANLNGSNIKYAFVGDASAIKPEACSVQTSASPNGNPGVDAMVSFVAHEMNKSVNDPNLTGWYDSHGDESADKCAWNFGSVRTLLNGSMANVTLGGREFLLQQNWLNAGGGSCALSYEAPQTHGADTAMAVAAVAASGSLIGTTDGSAAAVNLTTEGTMDWVHWGNGAGSRKAGVTAQLGNYSVVGGGGVLKYATDPRPLSFTDGTPTASGTNDRTGIYVDSGRAISITAPADTNIRTLIVHVGGSNSGATFTAHLSDSSAQDFTNAVSTVSGAYDRNYTLTYRAGGAGQTLTVTWKMAPGTGNVTFSAASLSGTPPAIPSISATSGGSQSTTISHTFAKFLQATVVDSHNVPVSGASVTFTAPGSGPSGTFGGSATATVVADLNGVASAPAFMANTLAGNYTVVATTPGAAAAASFGLTNTAGLPSTITALGGTPQKATVNTAFSTPLTAVVKDSGGNPVGGVTVVFTAPSSGSSAAFSGGSTAITSTDANGVATAPALTANATAGNYILTAGVSGLSGLASFALGNVLAGSGSGITLVQTATVNSGINVSSITVTFNAANTAGNWIGVAIYGGQGTAHPFTVTDSTGNNYQHALTQANTVGDATMGVYYAESIKAGRNTIKILPDHPGYLRVVVLEYAGVATSNSLDGTASAENTGLPNSGTINTTADGDLLLGVEITGDANSVTAGVGYKIEDQVPGLPGTKLTVEDEIQKTAGPAAATITSANNWGWAMGLAAFKRAP
jgi:hypothetical protein